MTRSWLLKASALIRDAIEFGWSAEKLDGELKRLWPISALFTEAPPCR